MDPIEKIRRWKRSLDGYIAFRKAVLLALFAFAFILYLGPSFFSWLFSSKSNLHYGTVDYYRSFWIEIWRDAKNLQQSFSSELNFIIFMLDRLPMCVTDKLKKHAADLSSFNGHITHFPRRENDAEFLVTLIDNISWLSIHSFSVAWFRRFKLNTTCISFRLTSETDTLD